MPHGDVFSSGLHTKVLALLQIAATSLRPRLKSRAAGRTWPRAVSETETGGSRSWEVERSARSASVMTWRASIGPVVRSPNSMVPMAVLSRTQMPSLRGAWCGSSELSMQAV